MHGVVRVAFLATAVGYDCKLFTTLATLFRIRGHIHNTLISS
jgi:hypothetical protein